MDNELDLATEDTIVIPTELQNFIQSLDFIPEVIHQIRNELFNPDSYYLTEGIDIVD